MPPTAMRQTTIKIPILIFFLIFDLGGRLISMMLTSGSQKISGEL
jgi:hypothetical protein